MTTIIDPSAPAWDDSIPKPRGLLPVPQRVLEEVEKFAAKYPPEIFTPEARKRFTDDWTLQYYYEDHLVVYRITPQGLEVLAVGDEEMGALVKGLSQEECLQVHIKYV